MMIYYFLVFVKHKTLSHVRGTIEFGLQWFFIDLWERSYLMWVIFYYHDEQIRSRMNVLEFKENWTQWTECRIQLLASSLKFLVTRQQNKNFNKGTVVSDVENMHHWLPFPSAQKYKYYHWRHEQPSYWIDLHLCIYFINLLRQIPYFKEKN